MTQMPFNCSDRKSASTPGMLELGGEGYLTSALSPAAAAHSRQSQHPVSQTRLGVLGSLVTLGQS